MWTLFPSASLPSYPVTLTKPSGALCFEEHDMGVQCREGEPIAGRGWLSTLFSLIASRLRLEHGERLLL
jgi:hypothetical protein